MALFNTLASPFINCRLFFHASYFLLLKIGILNIWKLSISVYQGSFCTLLLPPYALVVLACLSPCCFGNMSISSLWVLNTGFCVSQWVFMVCYITITSLSGFPHNLHHLAIPWWKYRFLPTPCSFLFFSTTLIHKFNCFSSLEQVLATRISETATTLGLQVPVPQEGKISQAENWANVQLTSCFFLLLWNMILLCLFSNAQRVRCLIYFV